MSRIYVTTDATSDIPKIYTAQNFDVIQMNYVMDGAEYECSPDSLDYDEFYSRVESGSMPTTSLINTQTAIDFFTPILKGGFDVLHVCFSSALSGTYNALKIAESELKEAFPERQIAVIDSKCASGGEGFMVWQVLKKREEGVSFDELKSFAEYVREHCVHFFTVQNLFHLYRGGRISKAAAVVGSSLNLKPVLHVSEEGTLVAFNKVMGRKASLKALVDGYLQKSKGWKNDDVWVCHGSSKDDAEWVAAKIKEKTPDVNVVVDYIGPIVGTHCGKGVIALFFLGEDKIKP